MTKTIVDVIASGLSREPDGDDYCAANSVIAALSAAGLPAAALEGVMAGTHAVVPKPIGAQLFAESIIACDHSGWTFEKQGRRCFGCGALMVDFGD